MFASCSDHLVNGTPVALFPEGGLAPAPALRPVRSGAARIALAARSAGVAGAEETRLTGVRLLVGGGGGGFGAGGGGLDRT